MAQLPQVYAGFGIHDIVFYKGADAKKFPNSEFLWRSPDGTTAFTTRLGKEKRWNFFFDFDIPVILGGDAKKPGWQSKFTYNTRLFHLTDDNFRNQYSTELKPDRYIRKEKILPAIDTVVSLLDETLSEHVLAAFDGTDFTSPLKEIPQVINMVNELKKGELELVHSTPEKYFEEVKADIDKSKLIEYEGEMRFGPVNHVHSETMGTNTEIKQAIWNAENKIINILEPMTAMLYSVGVQSDKQAMRAMWKKLLSAEAHDSIHGSGDPKIKTDNLNRLEQVNAMADSLIRRSAEALCREIRFDRNEIHIVALNTLPYARNEILRLTIDFPAEDLTEDFTIYDEDGNRVDYYPPAEYDFNLAIHNDLLIGFENETSQCLGRQCFEYSVMFHSCDKNILMESRIYQTDILACEMGMGNGGVLPEHKKFLDIKSGKTAVSAFKLSEEGDGAILRIYNPYGDSVKESIVFSEPVSDVWLCDFNEIPYEKAEIHNNEVTLEISPCKIVTLKYSLKYKS